MLFFLFVSLPTCASGFGKNENEGELDIEITDGPFSLINYLFRSEAEKIEYPAVSSEGTITTTDDVTIPAYFQFGLMMRMIYDNKYISVIYGCNPYSLTHWDGESRTKFKSYIRYEAIGMGTGFSPKEKGFCGSIQLLVGNIHYYEKVYGKDSSDNVLIDEEVFYDAFGIGVLSSFGYSIKKKKFVFRAELLGISLNSIFKSEAEKASGIGLLLLFGKKI